MVSNGYKICLWKRQQMPEICDNIVDLVIFFDYKANTGFRFER